MAAHIQFTRSAGALRSALAGLPDIPQDSLEKLTHLSARQDAGMLHLAVLGQFKRGKSTLVNALIGAVVLPTAAVPLTAIPTLIRYNERLSLSVEFKEDRDVAEISAGNVDDVRSAIATYATEQENPNNRLQVASVELSMPAPFLERGIVLIDTPGVGSTLAHNTETTLRFLEQCDAAIFVLSSDPPITASEIEFLRRVKDHVKRLVFVLNKIDYLSEKERGDVVAFVRRVIYPESRDGEELPFFPVSARDGLEARISGDAYSWTTSGMDALESYLAHIFTSEKGRILDQAIMGHARAVLSEILLSLELTSRAFAEPMETIEKKIEMLSAAASEIEREFERSDDVLEGERRRLQLDLEDRAAVIRTGAIDRFARLVETELAKPGAQEGEVLAGVLYTAVPPYFDSALADVAGMVEQETRRRLSDHIGRSEEMLLRFKDSAARIFEVDALLSSEPAELSAPEAPYWVTQSWDSRVFAVPPGLFERFMPSRSRRRRRAARIREQVSMIVVRNVENLRWTLLQNMNNSFRRIKQTMRDRFSLSLRLTRDTVKHTMEERSRLGNESGERLALLDREMRTVRELAARTGDPTEGNR